MGYIFALPRFPCSGSASGGGGGASADTRCPCLSSTWPTCRSDGMHRLPWKFALLRLQKGWLFEFESVFGCFQAMSSNIEAQPLGPSDAPLVPQGRGGGCTTVPCTICCTSMHAAHKRRRQFGGLRCGQGSNVQSSTSASEAVGTTEAAVGKAQIEKRFTEKPSARLSLQCSLTSSTICSP